MSGITPGAGEPGSEPAGTAARLPLCHSAAIEERGRAWVWDLLEFGQPARAFALRIDGVVHAYVNRCLHVPVEMDWNPGEFLDAGREFILCAVHGAAYEPATGRCAGGPCGRGRLARVEVAEEGQQVYWYPSRDLRPLDFEPVDAAPPPRTAP